MNDEDICRNCTGITDDQCWKCDGKSYFRALEWISVKDRLPGEGTHVLIYGRPKIGEVPYIVDQIYKGDWMLWGVWNNTSRGYIVTHWMPLPEPPEAVCE